MLNGKPIFLSKDIKFIMESIESNGFEIFLIGGFVRDNIIGRSAKDVDLVTSAKYKDLKDIFDGFSHLEAGKQFEVFMLKMNGITYEIATYRADGEYLDGRRPSSTTVAETFKEDVLRRDLTICGLGYNPRNGIIDLVGGISDIENKLIRSIGDPSKRFDEDNLRIMRCIRFSAQLGFSIEENTLKAIVKNKHLIKNVSKERIRTEFDKILLSDNPEVGIGLLIDLGLMEYIIPEFIPTIGFDQNNPYHKRTLDQHMIETMQRVPKELNLKLAGLFHDLGKLDTKTTDESGVSHYYGHEYLSAITTEIILNRMGYSKKIIKNTVLLVKNHMRIHNAKKSGIKRILNGIGEDLTRDLIKLGMADKNLLEDEKTTILETILDRQEPLTLKELAINGNDLKDIGVIGFEIGDILEYLMKQILISPNKNTRLGLLNLATDYRRDKPVFILMSGIPRSGKSLWVKNNKNDFIICSADRFRLNILGKKGDMSEESLIWNIHNEFFIEIIKQSKNIILDNTNVKPKYRSKFINIAKKNGYKIIGNQIETSFDTCLSRAKEDDFPIDVLFKFKSNYVPLDYKEGFDIINIIKGE